MKPNRSTILAWILFGLITASVILAIVLDLSTRTAEDNLLLAELIYPAIPVAFAFVGALIISHQPRNVIGLLLMLPGLSFFVLVDAYLRPFINGQLSVPQPPTQLLFMALWFNNWNWPMLVFPIMFVMVLFPTGRPLNRRWRWLIYYGLGVMVLLLLLATFAETLAPNTGDVDWAVRNPIGFLTAELIDPIILPVFVITLPIWVILCAVALLVRFRRANNVERNQIKWLLYAVAIFTLSYVPTFIFQTFNDVASLWSVLWPLGMLTIPAAIAIAILRYRLYDIDIIIRKTLVYAVLTGFLALVYFGTVILLQSVVGQATDEQSPLIIVLSTLLIAALFTPLRQRIQATIDRRFFRKKYDAQQVLAQFAQTARDETDMEALQAELLRVVQETMQPEQVSIWLQPVSGGNRPIS
jgi:MFS family permease